VLSETSESIVKEPETLSETPDDKDTGDEDEDEDEDEEDDK